MNLNKQGFTLIEILAVIVIIATIMLIVGPKVLDIFANTKTKAYNEQIDILKQNAKKYTAEFSYDVVWIGGVAEITIDNLIDAGYIRDEVINPKTGVAFCGDSRITITKVAKKYTYVETMCDTGSCPCS